MSNNTEKYNINKYPLFKNYLEQKVQLIHMLSAILYFREKLGYNVINEIFYNEMMKDMKQSMFNNLDLEQSEWKDLLNFTIEIASCYILTLGEVLKDDKERIILRINNWIIK